MPLPASSVTAVVTPSTWSAAGFVSDGYPRSKIHIVCDVVLCWCARTHSSSRRRCCSQVHHGVDQSIFFPKQPLRPRFSEWLPSQSWSDDVVVLLFVGAISPQKGVPELLRAFHNLLNTHAGRGGAQLRLVLKGQDALYNGASTLQSMLADIPEATSQYVSVRAEPLKRLLPRPTLIACGVPAYWPISVVQPDGTPVQLR